MEPDVPKDRPESPKKKIKPSSSVDNDVMSTDGLDRQTSIQNAGNENTSEVNGIAPTRSGRKLAADSTSESVTVSSNSNNNNNNNNESQSIQEDVVSSSENMTSSSTTKMIEAECDGNADSRSKKLDQTLSYDGEEQNDE